MMSLLVFVEWTAIFYIFLENKICLTALKIISLKYSIKPYMIKLDIKPIWLWQ